MPIGRHAGRAHDTYLPTRAPTSQEEIDMRIQRLQRAALARLCSGAAALAVSAATAAAAATIVDIGIDNNSSPDQISRTERVGTIFSDREFLTQATVPTEADESGLVSTFSTRFAWIAANHVRALDPDPSASFDKDVAYDLVFTVEDPGGAGYLLEFDTEFRGFVTASFDSAVSPPALVSARGTALSVSFDDGTGAQDVLSLVTPSGTATATDVDDFENELVADVADFNAGVFFGTKTFVLSFAPQGSQSPNVDTDVSFFNLGEAAVRFGLNPTLDGYTHSLTPGEDGEPLEDLGHFVNVTVTGFVVPEPGTLLLVGAGLAGLGGAGRRRRRERNEANALDPRHAIAP
jgi:hypothetical protein